MDIHVVQLDGTFFATLRADGLETVGQLLQQLPPDASGTPASWRRLILGSKHLHRHESLQSCGVQDGDTVCLVRTEPHFQLDLKGNHFGAAGLSTLAGYLPQDMPLKHLNIAHCNADASEGRMALTAICKKLLPLQQVDLTSNNLFARSSTEGTVEDLAAHLQVATGTVEDLAAHLHTATVEDLGDAVLMATVEDLTAHLAVKMLSLSRCRLQGAVGGKIVACFCKSAALEQIDISNNPGLKEAGFFAFVNALPPTLGLQFLDLSNCGLEGPEGGRLTASGVAKMPLLEHLQLCSNETFGSDGLAAFATSVYQSSFLLKSLDLSHCGLQDADGGRALAVVIRSLPELKKLNISKNLLGNLGMHAVCEGLAAASGLEWLTINSVGLAGEEGGRIIASCLATMPKLVLLSLMGNTTFGGAGLLSMTQKLLEHCHLRTLILNRCGLSGAITGRHLAVLMSHTHLLSLSDNPLLDGVALVAIAENLPKDVMLQSLFVSGCGLVGDAGGHALGRLTGRIRGLLHINLGSIVGLGVEGLLAMAECWQEGASVNSIDLADCRLAGASSGKALSAILLALPALTSVDLASNALGAEGIGALADSLTGDFAVNLRLKSLNLRTCGLVGREGGLAAAKLLSKLCAIEQLNLASNRDLGAEGVDELANGCVRKLALRNLDLSACGLAGVAGSHAIAKLLCQTPDLEQLGLSNNTLGTEGAGCLLAELPELTSLMSANLAYCRLEGHEGARAAAELAARLCMPKI